MLYRFALVILLFTNLSPATRAQDIRPVPGSGAGYLYFPADGDTRAVLKVIKETAGGLDTNYEVHLTFGSDPQELLCTDLDPDCEKTLGAGTVKLEIKGEWLPGKSWLAKHGKFSGACSGISTACQFDLQAGDTHTVRIKVGCNAHDYSVVSLGGGDQALCVTEHSGLTPSLNENNLLLAAHKKPGNNKKTKNKKGVWEIWSWEDGQDNTDIIKDEWSGNTGDSAAHYCDGLSLGSGSGKMIQWYLPAYYELEKALKGWLDNDFIINNAGGVEYVSSSEKDKKKIYIAKWSGSTIKRDTLKYKYTGTALCFHGVSP